MYIPVVDKWTCTHNTIVTYQRNHGAVVGSMLLYVVSTHYLARDVEQGRWFNVQIITVYTIQTITVQTKSTCYLLVVSTEESDLIDLETNYDVNCYSTWDSPMSWVTSGTSHKTLICGPKLILIENFILHKRLYENVVPYMYHNLISSYFGKFGKIFLC